MTGPMPPSGISQPTRTRLMTRRGPRPRCPIKGKSKHPPLLLLVEPQNLPVAPRLPLQHPPCPTPHLFGPHPSRLFLIAHLPPPTTRHLRLSPRAPHLHLLHHLTVIQRSWRWRWMWMMIMTGSHQPLELRRTVVGGFWYLLALRA